MTARIVWCAGMHASASTWLFNVVRQIMLAAQSAPVSSHFVAGASDLAVLDATDRVHVLQSHEVCDAATLAALDRRAGTMIVTMRDPRDSVVSLMQAHGYAFEKALAFVEASARLCVRLRDDPRALVLTYESGFVDDPATMERVATHLGLALTPAQRADLFAGSRRPVIDAYIAGLAQRPDALKAAESDDLLDPETNWHSHHAGRSGETGRWRTVLSSAQADAVAQRLGDCVAFAPADRAPATLTYHPEIFAVPDFARARAIILTDEEGVRSEARWEQETPYLAELIGTALQLRPDSLVLDYGCGIGRLSRALIERFGCTVVGVDISPSMRALAASFVASDRFLACAPEMLDRLVAGGIRADGAIAVWVLQHCFSPADDLGRLEAALRPGAGLVVMNNHGRAVPTREKAWVNDGIDIRALLRERFDERGFGRMDPARVTPGVAGFSFVATYVARAAAHVVA